MQKRAAPSAQQPAPKRRTYHPWAESFERGKTAFAQANYTNAIKHFSDAIALNSTNITLIDCRAAAYEKNGDLAKGLEDALAMIKASPTQSKGYLRAGKLFSIQERYSKALAIYNRALETVSHTDTRYAQLTEMKRSILMQRRKQKQVPMDFLQILPFDIVAHIFELLSFDRRIQCMAVCQSWRNTLKSWPGMWREIDFSSAKMSIHSLKQYMSYVNGRYVRKFTLQGNRNRATKMLQLLMERDCHYIESLRFIDCDLPGDLLLRTLRLMGKHLYHLELVDTGFSFANLPHILKTCPTITQLVYSDDAATDLTIDHPLALTHLSLSFSSKAIPFATLKNLLAHCPQLTHLSLYPPSGDTVLALAWQSCPELTSIGYQPHQGNTMTTEKKRGISELVFPTFCEISDDTLATAIQTNHDTLEILDIRGCPRLTSRTLHALTTDGAKQLREIYLENTAEFDEDVLCCVMQQCPSLQIVHMQSVVSVTNKVLEALSGATMLKHLNISNCPNVTGTGIRRLIDDMEGLQRLILNDCHAVNQDAVSYAREKLGRHGVECRYTTYR
ncbi:hypothetical protein BJV82DRAFT_507739 [Fennellomyces sp. T-0311]|nr:hypothetical protein BJV82DRAFT_507739 [Fennellomyces sp. T-0311]